MFLHLPGAIVTVSQLATGGDGRCNWPKNKAKDRDATIGEVAKPLNSLGGENCGDGSAG
jgi:hypothetical protein